MSAIRRAGFRARTLVVLIAATAVLLTATACGSSQTAAGGSGTKKLGFLVYDVGVDPWMNVAVKTVEDQGAKAGFGVTVINGHNDVGQMSAGMDQLINQGVRAILLAPSDQDSMVTAVKRAAAAKIPVFTFSLSMSAAAPVTSFIGADDVDMGKEQAKMVAEAIGGTGTVALMQGILGSGPQLGRTKGIHEALEQDYPHVKIVEEQANNWANDKTVSLTQDWLSKYGKGQLNAIVAQGPELTAGAAIAASTGRSEVKFIAQDYPADARAAIEKGQLYGTINQSPAVMAQAAVKAITTVTNGGTVEKKILIDTPSITRANVTDSPAAY